ncbi:hypothetical protein BDV28DRAFT_31110 [Aspergillus coremiiformis]|uniref:Uncharacterized protein n=1 Tax=Aspergillus coremiiformis TaxID=138285 RepID=A0A5N6ZHT1_9EURO|nr:hypothetical protein BDV28DRAFT_31110 [Aspergillus coremiiformis]
MRGVAALSLLSLALGVTADLSESNLKKFPDVLALSHSFNPIKDAYWTGYPHHRRTPFAVSPDGKTGYIAYLDASETDVHVQQVDVNTFAATGTSVTVAGGKEAGGLVAHNDGFALLTNEAMPSGTSGAPPGNTPVPVLYRYTAGKQTWKAWLGGPDVKGTEGSAASPDLNGDLAYSEKSGLYGAYFVITAYSGSAAGHFGDSIQYVGKDGKVSTIQGASSNWGCSHNTGIAFEAADEAPFASVCAEDQGAIWLNTKSLGMSSNGVKISNENTTNGGSGEPMGGMSGSYSSLARFGEGNKYIFTWVSRGAMDVTENTWMGSGYTHVQNRTNNRNVAITMLSDKFTKVGKQAISEVGAASGDSQIDWLTKGGNDCSNAHAATFGTSGALVTWEEISNPICDYIAMGCRGQFAGTFFQHVDANGQPVGSPFKSMDAFVAGDMATIGDGRICWPYVKMDWDLSQPARGSASSTTKMSFACMSLDGASSSIASTSSSSNSTSSNSTSSATTSASTSSSTSSNSGSSNGASSGASSNSASSNGASSNSASSNGASSNSASSNGASSNGAASNGASSNGAASNGASSNSASSNGASSNGAASNGASANGAASNGASSNGASSNGAASNGGSSKGAASNGASSNGAPQNGAPQNGAPSWNGPGSNAPSWNNPSNGASWNGWNGWNGAWKDPSPQGYEAPSDNQAAAGGCAAAA